MYLLVPAGQNKCFCLENLEEVRKRVEAIVSVKIWTNRETKSDNPVEKIIIENLYDVKNAMKAYYTLNVIPISELPINTLATMQYPTDYFFELCPLVPGEPVEIKIRE